MRGEGVLAPEEKTALPRVAVVILNWRRPGLTAACLESLARSDYPAWSAIVVDNGSGDDSVAMLGERFPGATVLENGRNLGFAAGNNPGIAHAMRAGSDYVLLLNDDTEVAPDLIRTLVAVAESDPRIGMVGPKILYADSPNVIWSAGGTISRLGVSRHRRVDEPGIGDDEPVVDVDYATGCAVLVRRGVLERVGALDERFYMYYEETEWCARARRAGFRVVYAPRARVWHKIAPNARSGAPFYYYLMTRNRLLYLRASGASAWVIGLATLEILKTATMWAIRPKYRQARPFAGALYRGVADFVRGRFGRPAEGM
jgi:GT2 family glycosyltransferase